MTPPMLDTEMRVLFFLLTASCLAQAALGQSTTGVPGLVQATPAGRSVKTEHGHMVPYRATIPGTEVSFDMVPIPGGKFVVGSPKEEEDRRGHEGPQVELEVKPFWMGRCEVTWAEYWVFMDCYQIFRKLRFPPPDTAEPVDAVTAPTPLYDPSMNYQFGDAPREPAVTMTQFAAKQYTKWLSLLTGEFYRLPTEAEWEYAARAGSQTAYFFGNDPDDLDAYAWFHENSNEKYHAVGSKKANPWGLHDIYGNVAELTLDPYEPNTYALWTEGSRSAGPVNWPKKIHREVVRGGSWNSQPCDLRSAARASTNPEWQESDPGLPKSPYWFTESEAGMVGFRIVRPLRKSQREMWERQWGGSAAIQQDVKDRLQDGRAGLGVVDDALRKAIQSTQDKKRTNEE